MHWFSILLAELNDHLGQASIRVLDACLEVAGLPQEGAPSLSIPKDQVLARLATVEGKPLDATAFRKRLQKINKATKDEIPLPDGEPPFRVRSTKGRIIIELGAGAAFHAQQAQSRRLAIESTRADVSNLTPTPQAPYVDGHQVFISYGWENDEVTEVFDGFIDSLARKLQHPPIKFASLPPVALWVDKSRVHGRSESFDDQTLPACRGSDVAVFMLSNKWHASSSCRAEAAVFERDGQVERERVICIQLCDDPHDNPAPYDKTPTYPELWRPDVRTLLRVWALEDAADRDEFVGRIAKEILEALTQLPPTPPSPGGHETAERDAHDRDGHRRRELAGTHWHDEQVRRKNVQVPHASESDADDVIKIIPLLQDWVCTDESRNRVVALLGSFGAGKTTTAQALATRLVELDPNDSSTPLPVYLDMRRLIEVFDTDRKDPLPLAELITRSLHQDVRANLDAQSLLNMLRTQRSLVIVDGLDEVGTRVGVERAGALFRQLLEIVPGSAWTRDLRNDGADWAACPTRLMVTCRTHFFRNHVEELSTLRGQDRAHPAVNRRGTVKTYYMAPFSPDQVEGFLKSALSEADSDNALSKIRRNEQLAALVRRPIMTRFIAEVSQDLHEDVDRGAAINGARIYHHIFARALARDADKRPLLTTGDREQLLCALALELWQQRKPVMNADELERWFDAYAAKHQGITAIMRSEAWARGSLQTELRNASLLVRERGDGFAFVHTSFQEYFLAKAISDAMLSDRLGELGAMPDVSNETVGFLVEMNADQIERLAAATGSLWSPSQQVATRAFAMRVTKALMLAGHRACVPDDAELSALDLRDFWPVLAQQQRRFQGVNFSHSNLRDTNFSRAHFSGCVFEGTQLAGSRFQGCELLDCRGEPRGLLTARGTDLSLGPDSPLARLGIRVEAADVPHASGRRRLTAPGWHTSSVLNARLSPDGTQILTASYDGTARLWDARSGDELRRFEGHGSVVTSGVFSPDGTRILTASYDGTARLWDARSGDELCRFEGHGDWVCSGVSGPDGARILTASYDGTARLWDARSGDELRRFEGHGSVVTSGVFSPDGTRILTASDDRTARLWDARSGDELRRFEGHGHAVTSGVFSPDGTRILTTSDDGTARLWDAGSGDELGRFEGHGSGVTSGVFSPDGTRILTASNDRTARLWDARSGDELRRFEGHGSVVTSGVFSPDGTRILTASNDGTARLWDAGSGDELRRFEGHGSVVTSGVFSPDGTRILTASNDGTARLWDARSGDELRRFEGHGSGVTSGVFSPDGTRILTASNDRTARLWDARSGDELRRFEGHGSVVTSGVFSPDGTRILTASNDGTARLWDAGSGDELRRFEGHGSVVTSGVFSPDGTRILTASNDGTARLWDARSGDELRRFEGHGSGVTSGVFSPDGTWILTASNDGTARLWDARSGDELRRFEGHGGWVRSGVFSPDGTWVLTASDDGTARLWDAGSGDELRRFEGHGRVVTSGVFSPDGTRILTASYDGTARLWDARSGDELRRFEGHGDWVRSAMFSPNGTAVVIADSGGNLVLWAPDQPTALARLRVYPDALLAFDAGRQVIAGTGQLWKYVNAVETDATGEPRLVAPTQEALHGLTCNWPVYTQAE